MFRKKAFALLTAAAVLLFGNAVLFPPITVSAASEGTTTVSFKPNVTKSVAFKGEERAWTMLASDDLYEAKNDNKIQAAVAKKVGSSVNIVAVKDITVTYDYTFKAAKGDTVSADDADIGLDVFGGGGDANNNGISLSTNSVPLGSLKGKDKTVKFSDLCGDASSIDNIWYFSIGIHGNGKKGDSLKLTIKKITVKVKYEKIYNNIEIPYDDFKDAEAIKVTYKLAKATECEHGSHAGAIYCTNAGMNITLVSSADEWLNDCYWLGGGTSGDKAEKTVVIPLKDIYEITGTPKSGDKLYLQGNQNAEPVSYELMEKYVQGDIVLDTGSIASGTIEEAKDWTPDGEIPNGKADLRFGNLTLVSNGNETSFKGYKTIKIDYTVDDPSQMASIMVILHGWGDNAVGWEALSYKVKSSGTVTVDLTPYQNKTYYNIYVCAVAPKTAKIGDKFTPGFTVTNAMLLTSDSAESGGSSAALSGVKASSTKNSVTLTWDKASGADMYRVYKYNDKTGKYEKYKDVKSAKCTVSGLKAGTKYKFKVAAYSKNNDGKYVKGESSKAVSVTTKS